MNAANPDTYNKIMGLNYDVTIKNIQTLLKLKKKMKSKLKVQVSFVISNNNKKEIRKFTLQWINKTDMNMDLKLKCYRSMLFHLMAYCYVINQQVFRALSLS